MVPVRLVGWRKPSCSLAAWVIFAGGDQLGGLVGAQGEAQAPGVGDDEAVAAVGGVDL